MRFLTRASVAALAFALLTGAALPDYRVERSIAGPDGGWDYARVDPAGHRLYVARGTEVMEVDLAHGDAVRSFGAVAKGHAVVPIADRHLLLVTSAHDDSARLFDTGDGHQVASIAVGSDPDAALYDEASGTVLVANAKAGTVSVIDIAGRKVIRTIALKPGLEFAVIGPDGALFVNNEDENEIETADPAAGASGAPIPLAGCEGPTGLGYDEPTGTLISACANGKAAVVDARARKLVKLLDIGRGPDAVIVDAARRLAFVPCGRDGTLSVIALDRPGGPAVVTSVRTAIGARTGALDPKDGSLYLPAVDFGAPSGPGARPSAKPGSFRILVVRPRGAEPVSRN